MAARKHRPITRSQKIQVWLPRPEDVLRLENWYRWTETRKKVDVMRDMLDLFALQEQEGIPLHEAVALIPKIYEMLKQGVSILSTPPKSKEGGIVLTELEEDEHLVVDLDMVARWDL